MTDMLDAMCAAYYGADWWNRHHPMGRDDCRRNMQAAVFAQADWFDEQAKAGERRVSSDIAARAIREEVTT